MEEEEEEPERSHKRLPRGSSCLICKRGKRRCDGKRPTCGRCERVGCTCVYGQVGSRRTVKGRGTDKPPPARKAAASPRPNASVSEAFLLARSDWTVGASPPREPPPVASLVRPPSDWVVGGALPMAQITGSIIEAIVRMRSEDVLDIPKTKAFLKRIGPTINRAVGNDVIRYFRGLLESEARGDDSADSATALTVRPLTQKRRKTAAGLAHVLLSWEDQGSIWLRFSSGLTGSLEVTVSEAMAKLFITTEELAVMIKESKLAPCYSWTMFIEPDSVAAAADALYRTLLERDSNNTRSLMIQCQTRQGLSVRCHANLAWNWGNDQVASALVVRLKPMIRLSRLSPDYHYITPSTLVAAAGPNSPLCDPSHGRSRGSLEPGMDMGRRQDVPMLCSPPVAYSPPWCPTCSPLPAREPTWRAEEERGAWLGSAQHPSIFAPHVPSGGRHLVGRRTELDGYGFDLARWTGALSYSPRSAGSARTADLSKVLEHAATGGTRYVLSDDEDRDARGREAGGARVGIRGVDSSTGGLALGDAYEDAETGVRTWRPPDEEVYRVAGVDGVHSAPHADDSDRNASESLDDLSVDEWTLEAVRTGGAGRSMCGPIGPQLGPK